MAEMEALDFLMVKRGNLQKEISQIGEEPGEGTEIQTVTLFKLMKAFEKVILKLQERNNKPVHTVVQYNYTMEESREYMLTTCSTEKTVSFEKIFEEYAKTGYMPSFFSCLCWNWYSTFHEFTHRRRQK